MEMYGRLAKTAADCDVFFLYNGANIHPEFLSCLSTYNIYSCFDDPESSADLSAPVASAFDGVFYGNIAARYQYEHWGCDNLCWLPIFTAPGDVPTKKDGERLLETERDNDIVFVGEKNHYRKRRLEKLRSAFPQARCHGRNWPEGRIGEKRKSELLSRSKIGWNVHNSTGPINRRLFTLPAYGVMQLCDNKTGLGKIFDLDEEAVGFDTIPEAIELTRYFLEHSDERQYIAEKGFRRFWKEYHPQAIWNRIADQIDQWTSQNSIKKPVAALPERTIWNVLGNHKKQIRLKMGRLKRKTTRLMDRYRKTEKKHPVSRDERFYLEESLDAYVENPEMKGVNMARERLEKGQPFEWPNMLALNWAVTSIIRDAKKIVEIGSGTGPFADLAAIDSSRTIHCYEQDDYARSWAEKKRDHPNVFYHKKLETSLSKRYDLLVSIDVIEHVGEMRGFLEMCAALARRAVFSTPNRHVVRNPKDMGPPLYAPHVREFVPGELYWILRQYYRDVYLYHMPDVYVPWLEPMTIVTHGTPIIAECKDPIR
jgi:2-polyprenyl-3-methyl-5-hydroxy-6-metoxy-1,4-benzoquinol methylase